MRNAELELEEGQNNLVVHSTERVSARQLVADDTCTARISMVQTMQARILPFGKLNTARRIYE